MAKGVFNGGRQVSHCNAGFRRTNTIPIQDSLVAFVHEQRQDIFAACINHLVTPLYVVIDEIIGQFLQDKLQGLAKEVCHRLGYDAKIILTVTFARSSLAS